MKHFSWSYPPVFKHQPHQAGSALIPLLVFMTVAIMVTTTAGALVLVTSQNTATQAQSVQAQLVAQSGMENALLQLIRDPSYTGEVLAVGSGTASITVTGPSPYQITSIGQSGQFQRTIEAEATYSNGQLTVTSWNQQW